MYKMTEVIYKIYCKDETIKDLYVGSTDNFDRRCGHHISNCNNKNIKSYNYKVYKFIREHGGFDNFIIEEIIECDESNRYEAEVHYFLKLNSTLNTRWPKRSQKQYRIDNKEHISDQHRQYYNENKEQILEQRKQSYIDNRDQILEKAKTKIQCECGTIVSFAHISRHNKSQKHKNYISTK